MTKLAFPRYVLLQLLLCGTRCLWAAEVEVPAFVPKPVPLMQSVPLPLSQISFQRDGTELARYYYGPEVKGPFVFPMTGPSGRSLTRMGHPHDPETHRHHHSAWLGHRDVNGVNFWEERGQARIVHQRIERLTDAAEGASVESVNAWLGEDGKILLREKRLTGTLDLGHGEWLLLIDLELEPDARPVTLGKTPFGLMAVRMAKTIGVHDGGGRILNSEGGVNEAGVLWKRARWVDYSGPIQTNTIEGITLMDHPLNPQHPAVFHVRDDGWMGVSLTFDGPRTLEKGKPLRLRYGMWIHAGLPDQKRVDSQWRNFAGLPWPMIFRP